MILKNRKIHFIAIGGSAMHQIALVLRKLGNTITGSDDEIFEPSRSALQEGGLLPEKEGWFPDRIQADLDMVVLGMHARADNPELIRARELGIRVLSYPELIYEHAEHKQRIVVAGSHGKTTTTAMIMHVLKECGRSFDYLVGARVPGFDQTVRLSEEAPIIILEGDEYPSSALNPNPKFLVYKHHIGLVTGIAWDHMNVFPTEHVYVRQFDHFADSTPKAGILVMNDEDALASVICKKEREDVTVLEYGTPKYTVRNGHTYLITADGKEVSLPFFGAHNLSNANGARVLLSKLGVRDEEFYSAISRFEGASMRLQRAFERPGLLVFRDFAHAPSKVEASVLAVKTQFPGKRLTAVLELHTFSSLNPEFLPQYEGKLASADQAIVYFNPQVVAHKKLPPISESDLQKAFGKTGLAIFTDSAALFQHLKSIKFEQDVLLLMSSGTFDGQNLNSLYASL